MKNEKAKSISEDKKLDEMELQRMLEVYGNDVLRLCTLYLKDRHLAEDALQETFIKVWQKYHTYLGQANEKTWIMRIAINVCKNYLRTAWIKRNSVVQIEDIVKASQCKYRHIEESVDYEMTNNIMNNTVRNSGKKYRGFRKKAIVVVTLATLCIGTMAVGVSGFSGAWNNIVQLIQHKGIEMDEAQAVNFSKKGYIDVADADKVTATNSGITVSLIQTISDKKAIYLYLKVKSEDKKLNNGMSFVWAKINIKGFGNIDGVAGDINVTSDYEGVFEVRMDVLSEYKEKNLDIDGKDIKLTLNCLRQVYKTSADYKVNDDVSQGEWKINWKGKSNNSSKVIKPNQTIIHHKNKLTVIKMEITPLTVTIDFDYPARKEYEEIYIPFTVVMKDGTKYKTTESGFNTIFYGNVMGKNLAMNISKPLDIDEIDYVDIAGKQYKVQ